MNSEIMPITRLTAETDDLEYHSKTCFYSGCTEKPIISHTIAKNYLYKLHPDLTKVLTMQPKITPIITKPTQDRLRKVKVDKFSTFVGFCKSHDNDLFRSIDVFDGIMNQEKAALIHYRNICYGISHIRTKQLCEQRMSQQCYVQGKSLNKTANRIARMLKKGIFARRLEYCLKQHLTRKHQLEKMIKFNSFDDIIFCDIPGALKNPIFCGRSSYLLHPKNRFFSGHGYSYIPWITYMTLLTDNENRLLFCWLKIDDMHARYFKKLNNQYASDVIAILAYTCSDAFAVEENYYKKHIPVIEEMIKLRTY